MAQPDGKQKAATLQNARVKKRKCWMKNKMKKWKGAAATNGRCEVMKWSELLTQKSKFKAIWDKKELIKLIPKKIE